MASDREAKNSVNNTSETSVSVETIKSTLDSSPVSQKTVSKQPKEIGGRTGPEPTRFGDWEKNGRCIDF